ncbi:serine/threonine protein kinase, sensor for unfolded proteins in the ER Ire1 [Schizosaccharomyces osmophilus]|uniref:non-specific serine/threonine protein kinase n=1 Tax=Schizosaccharomyces osmophilus TaxID=2545709 RepID=A0AAE9WCG7_9SCHI|nr:serine/threonine protein kinase, sensor for unfolded proteins in the ER Ire1 [Schizosaccharomyces osmophilus]WBW72642.1 serine/threonine protein kinase, sensor for unfolded proteins in the ER Ire1 [Schizosaccharomyces osmophilus]
MKLGFLSTITFVVLVFLCIVQICHSLSDPTPSTSVNDLILFSSSGLPQGQGNGHSLSSSFEASRNFAGAKLQNVFLVSTVDGILHGYDRSSGNRLWSLGETENVSVLQDYPILPKNEIRQFTPSSLHSFPGDRSLGALQAASYVSGNDTLWFVEPIDGGILYAFNIKTGLVRLPHNLRSLVNASPIRLLDNNIFVGSKQTTLLTIDALSGKIFSQYDSRGSIQAARSAVSSSYDTSTPNHLFKAEDSSHRRDFEFGQTKAGGDAVDSLDLLDDNQLEASLSGKAIIDIARTEYKVSIYQGSSLLLDIIFVEWSPSKSDLVHGSSYRAPLDSKLAFPNAEDDLIVLDLKKKRVVQNINLAIPATSVFDVVSFPESSTEEYSYFPNSRLLHQPIDVFIQNMFPNLFSNDTESVYLNTLSPYNWYAMSTKQFPLVSAVPNAACYLYPGSHVPISSIIGLHPLRTADVPLLSLPTECFPEYYLEGVESDRLALSSDQNQVPLLDAGDADSPSSLLFRSILILSIALLLGLFIFFSQKRKQKFGARDAMPENPNNATTDATKADITKRRRKNRKKRRTTDEHEHGNVIDSFVRDSAVTQTDNTGTVGNIGPIIQKSTSQNSDGSLTLNSLTIFPDILGYGSHGTIVYRGKYEDRDVAVKRILLDFYELATREIQLLQKSDDHPNIVRYYCRQQSDKFLYVVIELGECTLAEVIEHPLIHHEMVQEIDRIALLYQIALGLRHLHTLDLVHRDLKPQNILLSRKVTHNNNLIIKPLISDFGLSKKVNISQSSFHTTTFEAAGSYGWRSQEILRGLVSQEAKEIHCTSHEGRIRQASHATDIFALGCIFYFTLSGGKHPFGNQYECESNILKGEYNLEDLGLMGEYGTLAVDLISEMISFSPKDRPTIENIVNHPLFWNYSKKLDFLINVSDRFEAEERDPPSPLLQCLENNAHLVVGKDWMADLHNSLIDNLGRYRKYDGSKILDILRVLRNKRHHYQDLPDNVRALLGSLPDGFTAYFTEKFPLLLLHCFHVVKAELYEEPQFERYFNADYLM